MTMSVVFLLFIVALTLLVLFATERVGILHVMALMSLSMISLFAILAAVFFQWIPLPNGGELERVTALKAPGFVWGASGGWEDYRGYFTFYADITWVASAVATKGLTLNSGGTQARCLRWPGDLWWVTWHEDDKGTCWWRPGSDGPGEIALFFAHQSGRVTIHMVTE